MAVDKILPVGTKVRIEKESRAFSAQHLNEGDIYTIIFAEDTLDGQSHRIDEYSFNKKGLWVFDSDISVVESAEEDVARKTVTFQEIVQMISEGKVPAEAKFISDDNCEATVEYDGTFGMIVLRWDSGKNVQLSKETASSTWVMETPDLKLTALEAMAELQKGNSVKGVHYGDEFTLSPYVDFDDIWEESPWGDMDDLLNYTEFYKVAA